MSDLEESSGQHRERILGLYGQPVRRVTLDEENALMIEFGDSDRTAVFTTIGSVWRWETADRMIVAIGDDHDTAVTAMADLVGRKLTKIRTQRPSVTVWLAFDDDSNLLVFPVTSDGFEHWTMDYPDGWLFTAGPGVDAGWDPPAPEETPRPTGG